MVSASKSLAAMMRSYAGPPMRTSRSVLSTYRHSSTRLTRNMLRMSMTFLRIVRWANIVFLSFDPSVLNLDGRFGVQRQQ
jgi:hypothetical protein